MHPASSLSGSRQTELTYAKSILKHSNPSWGLATQTVLHPELTGPLSAAHAKSDPVTGDSS